MDLRILEMYQTVCEFSSISKASQQLFLSRQALTEVMNKLELEIGVTLLTRSHNGIKLTEEGRFLFLKSRKLLAEWGSILEEIKDIAAPQRQLRIGSTLALMSDELICGIIALGDDVNAEIVLLDKNTDDCITLVEKGDLDAAYSGGDPANPQLELVPIASPFHETYVAMSPKNRLAGVPRLRKNDLKTEIMLLPDERTYRNQCIIDYARSIEMRLRLVPSIHSVQKSLVKLDEGLLFIPGNAVPQFVQDSSIIAKPLSEFPHLLNQSLMYNRNISEEKKEICYRIARYLEDSCAGSGLEFSPDGTVRAADLSV